MASLSPAFPLLQSAQQSAASKTFAATVQNSTSELVIAVDGEGISIHNIAPNRVSQAFSTGLDVKFLCAPLSVRNDLENSTTWALLEEKGEEKLLCWTQRGVETITHTIPLSTRITSILSILQVDEMGETVALNYNNARLVCFSLDSVNKLWDWQAPKKSSCLETFKAGECALTKTLSGFVLASISDKADYYTISPGNKVSKELLSIPLVDIPNPVFDHKTCMALHLSSQELKVRNLDDSTPIRTFQLPTAYDKVSALSTSHVLLGSKDVLMIYDIVYGTVQAYLDISSSVIALVPTSDPLSFQAALTSDNLTQLITITIPERATLLDVITHRQPIEESLPNNPTLLVAPKLKLKPRIVKKAISEFFNSVRSAVEAKDAKAVDNLFKEFRERYNIRRRQTSISKTTKLTPMFVKEFFSVILTKTTQNPTFEVYPEETITYFLESNSFSRDMLPGGAEQLIPTALGNKAFLKKLLKTESTPLMYRDYLLLVQHVLDTPADSRTVSTERVLDAFERGAENFFDKPDMRTVLSADHLERLLQLITATPDEFSYPNILASTLDSLGLGPLILSPSLSAPTIQTLHETLLSQTDGLKTCLETSSLISLLLHRQNDVPISKGRERAIFFKDRKRKVGETGWLDVVAQEGGMTMARRGWIKRPALPTSEKGMTHRFVATTKFQEAPVYSLDKMVL